MALQDVKGINIVPGVLARTLANTLNNITLDAADEHCGAILWITKTGTLNKIGIRTGGTASAVGTLRVALETVDMTTGRPSGTLYNANAYVDITTWTSSTTYWLSLQAGVAVTAGDLVAVTCRWQSYTSGILIISNGVGNANAWVFLPYCYNYVGAVWTFTGSAAPNFGFEYSTGIVPIWGTFPAAGITSVTWNSGSNPDRRGLRFKLTYKAQLVGALVTVDLDSDANILLYDSDGTTVLETISLDSNVRQAAGTGSFFVYFSTARTLTVDSWYRIVILPTTVTNLNITGLSLTNDGSNIAMDGIDGGQDFHYTTANGAPTVEGDWTNYTATRPITCPIIAQLDDGVGGGGGVGIIGGIGK